MPLSSSVSPLKSSGMRFEYASRRSSAGSMLVMEGGFALDGACMVAILGFDMNGFGDALRRLWSWVWLWVSQEEEVRYRLALRRQ
jgi:hypothetical protein